MRSCYIAGPMRGHPDSNRAAFYDAERALWTAGWTVFNPARMDDEAGADKRELRDYVRRDLGVIVEMLDPATDAVILLDGWQASIGARAEFAVAEWMKIRRIELLEAIQ